MKNCTSNHVTNVLMVLKKCNGNKTNASLQCFILTRLGCFYVTAILSWGYGWGWVEAEVDLSLRLKWGWDEI